MDALHSLRQVVQPVQVVRDGLAQVSIALGLKGMHAQGVRRLLHGVRWGTSTRPTPDKLSLSSTAARRTCSSLSICSLSRSSSSCIIIRPSSGLGPALVDILEKQRQAFGQWLLQKKHTPGVLRERVNMNDAGWMNSFIIMGRTSCIIKTQPYALHQIYSTYDLFSNKTFFLSFPPPSHLSSHHSSLTYLRLPPAFFSLLN